METKIKKIAEVILKKKFTLKFEIKLFIKGELKKSFKSDGFCVIEEFQKWYEATLNFIKDIIFKSSDSVKKLDSNELNFSIEEFIIVSPRKIYETAEKEIEEEENYIRWFFKN